MRRAGLGVDADHDRHSRPQHALGGNACTILVKLPVALSGGKSENTEPEAGDSDMTLPVMS
jgi:hypothetical protein